MNRINLKEKLNEQKEKLVQYGLDPQSIIEFKKRVAEAEKNKSQSRYI